MCNLRAHWFLRRRKKLLAVLRCVKMLHVVVVVVVVVVCVCVCVFFFFFLLLNIYNNVPKYKLVLHEFLQLLFQPLFLHDLV